MRKNIPTGLRKTSAKWSHGADETESGGQSRSKMAQAKLL